MKVIPYPGLTAFNKDGVIGTHVIAPDAFLPGLVQKIEEAQGSPGGLARWKVESEGKFSIPCPELRGLVSPGVGRRTKNPDDYHLVHYREKFVPFLKRHKAISSSDCDDLKVVLKTGVAFMRDEDVQRMPNLMEWCAKEEPDYVIIVVLYPDSPPPPWRVAANYWGGEYSEMSDTEVLSLLKESFEFWRIHETVADEPA